MAHLLAQADAARLPLADASVDMTFGSPPYCDARTYGIGAQRDCREWVDWMLGVTEEALRVSRGLVLWVCAGVTRDHNYWPACEGLLWEGWKRGWLCECPAYWHRVGVPGSGGSQWLRKDVEYVLAFKREKVLPWSDNTACGHPPKWAPGGDVSHRLTDGRRVHTKRSKRSVGMEVQHYQPPTIANPGNYIAIEEQCSSVVDVRVGGGHLGHPLSHENEAPFPEALAEFFIRTFCPPDGITLDPFSGSGTTAAVCDRLGRHGIGFDLRRSQCELGMRRLTRPHAPVVKKQAVSRPMPLFDAEAANARGDS